MAKRKQSDPSTTADASDSDSGSDVSTIDVDFDFCSLNPTIDYQAIHRLLVQLFQSDAESLHTHDLTDLILTQGQERGLGTTVKTDGEESDPLGLITVLNMHQENKGIKALASYALSKASSNPTFQATLQDGKNKMGVVICERLMNMPVQLVPPMYTALLQEIQASGKDYEFSHILIFSRAYHLSLDEETLLSTSASRAHTTKTKKPKRAVPSSRPEDGIYSFHPEDEAIMRHASFSVTYPFPTNGGEREKDAFGLDLRGRLMLVPMDSFAALVREMTDVYSAT